MRRILMGALLTCAGLAVGLVVGPGYRGVVGAQTPKSKDKFQEVDIGVVPTEFGTFKSLSGTSNSMVLSFESDKGELRILQFHGNKLSPQVFKVKREY